MLSYISGHAESRVSAIKFYCLLLFLFLMVLHLQTSEKPQYCRYKPNDHFLKELIEEWCEGVIQENGQSHDSIMDQEGTNLGRPVSLLFEKVASHLQERTAGNLAIDLQGLTKVS